MDKKKLGARIRQARNNAGLSALELSEMVSLNSATYVLQLERGEKVPKAETLVNIANALKVSADSLLCDSLEIKVLSAEDDLCGKIHSLPSDYQRFVLALVDEMHQRTREIKSVDTISD